MNARQVQKFTLRYLETTGCRVIEKTPYSVTVKLSPEADKDLTGRTYYWSFVERTGAEPETMTYCFVFDPDAAAKAEHARKESAAGGGRQRAVGGGSPKAADPVAGAFGAATAPSSPAGAVQGENSILARYFGVNIAPASRIPRDEVRLGSRRLEQLFAIVKRKGRFVRLFEDPGGSVRRSRGAAGSGRPPVGQGVQTWLGVNFKVEFLCDMKRDEMHSLGIDLATGAIREHFHDWLSGKKLSPILPAGIYVEPSRLTVARAYSMLEQAVEKRIKTYDHGWSREATDRLNEELERIDGYYTELLENAAPEEREAIEAQLQKRRSEALWQYQPRIHVSVVNGGLFHLIADH